MLRKSIYASEGEPSFFYLMMADSCFQRARSTRHPNAGGALRNLGSDYLMKATEVSSVFSQSRRSWPDGRALDRTGGREREA
jgi:hypothetical protein